MNPDLIAESNIRAALERTVEALDRAQRPARVDRRTAAVQYRTGDGQVGLAEAARRRRSAGSGRFTPPSRSAAVATVEPGGD